MNQTQQIRGLILQLYQYIEAFLDWYLWLDRFWCATEGRLLTTDVLYIFSTFVQRGSIAAIQLVAVGLPA